MHKDFAKQNKKRIKRHKPVVPNCVHGNLAKKAKANKIWNCETIDDKKKVEKKISLDTNWLQRAKVEDGAEITVDCFLSLLHPAQRWQVHLLALYLRQRWFSRLSFQGSFFKRAAIDSFRRNTNHIMKSSIICVSEKPRFAAWNWRY